MRTSSDSIIEENKLQDRGYHLYIRRKESFVMPAEAGIQRGSEAMKDETLDSRLRGNDGRRIAGQVDLPSPIVIRTIAS